MNMIARQPKGISTFVMLIINSLARTSKRSDSISMKPLDQAELFNTFFFK